MTTHAEVAVNLERGPVRVEELILIRYSVGIEHSTKVALKHRCELRWTVHRRSSPRGLTKDKGVAGRPRYLAKMPLAPKTAEDGLHDQKNEAEERGEESE